MRDFHWEDDGGTIDVWCNNCGLIASYSETIDLRPGEVIEMLRTYSWICTTEHDFCCPSCAKLFMGGWWELVEVARRCQY